MEHQAIQRSSPATALIMHRRGYRAMAPPLFASVLLPPSDGDRYVHEASLQSPLLKTSPKSPLTLAELHCIGWKHYILPFLPGQERLEAMLAQELPAALWKGYSTLLRKNVKLLFDQLIAFSLSYDGEVPTRLALHAGLMRDLPPSARQMISPRTIVFEKALLRMYGEVETHRDQWLKMEEHLRGSLVAESVGPSPVAQDEGRCEGTPPHSQSLRIFKEHDGIAAGDAQDGGGGS